MKKSYNKKISLSPLAETWECSIHPDGASIIAVGEFKNRTLTSVLKEHPEYLGSKVNSTKELPILVKLIDADKDLSVQVHPNDEYARVNENQNGKTEMWYVLEAEHNASLMCGFAHNVTREQIEESILSGQLMKHIQKVNVNKGDVFFIPAGTIHAIGAGSVIAEIQQNSNVTYRVYDYDRLDKNGQKRELHFDKALEVLNLTSGVKIRQQPRTINYYPGCSRELLCRCKYFEVERIKVVLGLSFAVNEESFQILLCIDGEGGLETNSLQNPMRFKKGDCIFIPADIGRCHILGKNELLKIRC